MAIKPTDGQKRVSFVAPSTRPMLAVPASNGRAPASRLGFQPTEEQEAIRAAAATGEDVAVIALAGTGKTTTLQMLARDRSRQQMTYVAFNRAIADEAQRRFPSNVTCQPAGTMVRVPVGQGGVGAVSFEEVPIESLVDGDKVVSWNTNHGGVIRKRGRSVQVGQRDYDGPLVTVRADDRCSRYTPQHKCVVSIGDAFAGQYVVYMMRRGGLYRIGVVAWNTKQGVRNGMLMRALAQKCDAFWILSVHDDREDAILTEQLTQYDFNVPGWRFVSERSGIDTILWTKIDPSRNAANAEFCLASFGRSVAHPLWTSADHGRLAKSHMVTVAANLMTGMRVLVADNCESKPTSNGFMKSHAPLRLWSRVEVSAEWYTGKVYSMDVADDETYVGDGIVTHNCKTMHSFAFGAVGRHFQHRLNGPRVPAWKAANILRIPERFEFGAFSLRSHQLARLALEAVQRFCHSDSPDPSRSHIPKVPGLESPEARDALTRMLYPFVVAAWEDLSGQDGQLRFTHDCYLKLWAMGSPSLPGDVVLADEAQDFDPVIKQIVEMQTGQKIYVGDSCQPSGTMVTVVAGRALDRGRPFIYKDVPIEDLRAGDSVLSYNISKRYLRPCGSQVLGVSSRPFNGDLVQVQTQDLTSSYTPDHRVVVRIGLVGSPLDSKHVVYLMRRNGQYRIGKSPWRYGESANNVFGPYARANTEKADAFWILSVHDTGTEASLAEAIAAWRFGIPSWTFVPHRTSVSGLVHAEFWSCVGDNSAAAENCLSSFGRDVRFPLWDRFTPGNLLKSRAVVIRACNLLTGMHVLPASSAALRTSDVKWAEIVVSREPYSGLVYSMDVEEDETYVGDGIITHNCQQIYEWRGSVDALSAFQVAHRLPLQKSFRFGPAIADEANRILELLETDLRVVGHDPVESKLAYLSEPDCVLTRTNSEAIARLMAAQVEGVRAGLVGGTAQVEALAQAALDLTNGRKTTHHELLAFDNWQQVREYVEEDSDAKELQVLVKLVDRHGAEVLLDAVQRAVPEHTADLVISTAHKAKGREWERVAIASDFQEPRDEDTGEWNKSELRLSYVAITRAKEFLDCSALGWLTWQAGDDPERQFLAASEVPERECVEVAHAPTEQLIPDPEDATRLMFCRTPYNAELVDAQRGLPRSKFYGLYCGEEKVRVVLATVQAIAVAERFHLTISDAARARVAELAG